MDKKQTIPPINKKDIKCFKYAVTVALNHEQRGKHCERMKKIKSFMNKYNWKEINFLSEKDDWEQFQKNNVTIVINY